MGKFGCPSILFLVVQEVTFKNSVSPSFFLILIFYLSYKEPFRNSLWGEQNLTFSQTCFLTFSTAFLAPVLWKSSYQMYLPFINICIFPLISHYQMDLDPEPLPRDILLEIVSHLDEADRLIRFRFFFVSKSFKDMMSSTRYIIFTYFIIMYLKNLDSKPLSRQECYSNFFLIFFLLRVRAPYGSSFPPFSDLLSNLSSLYLFLLF